MGGEESLCLLLLQTEAWRAQAAGACTQRWPWVGAGSCSDPSSTEGSQRAPGLQGPPSAFRTHLQMDSKQEPRHGQHTETSFHRGESICSVAWLCLKHRSPPVCSCTGKPFPRGCTSTWVSGSCGATDRQPEHLPFFPRFNSSSFSTVGFILQKP